MTLHAITVLGHDAPGIIAGVTDRLAVLGLNLEDATMTRLRGHFAMTLICRGEASTAELESALVPDGGLTVAVHELPDADADSAPGTPWVLSVHGGDRPGIVSAITAEVARVGGNITDLTTRLAGGLYVLVAEFELPEGGDASAVGAAIAEAADELGVEASLRPAEADDL